MYMWPNAFAYFVTLESGSGRKSDTEHSLQAHNTFR